MGSKGRWWLFAALGAAVVGAHVVASERIGPYLVVTTAIGAALAMGRQVRSGSSSSRRGLVLMMAALAFNAFADLILNFWELLVGSEPPYPGPADPFYLAFYPLMAAGLAWMIRQRSSERERSALIDAGIVTLGAGVVLWQYLILPLRAENDVNTFAGLVSVAYPSGDLLLLAYTARLALTSGRRPRALQLLIAGLVMLFAADVVYSWSEATGAYFVGAPIDALYDVSYLLMMGAFLHPSFRELLLPAEKSRSTMRWGRLGLLTGATLLAPLVALSTGERSVFVPVLTSAVMFVLVMSRVAGLMVELERSGERRLRALVQHSTDFLMVVDSSAEVSFGTPSTERALVAPGGELAGTPFGQLVHPDDRHRVAAAVLAAEAGERAPEVEGRLRFADGRYRSAAITVTNLLGDGDVNGFVINAHDVDDLRQLASFDSLTGLANRGAFIDRLDEILACPDGLAVLLLDLDGFKEINDSLGHAAGDAVLREVAHRLRAQTRRHDVVARLGGDEFAMIVSDADGYAGALCERILRSIAEPIILDDLAVSVDVSIGVAIRSPEHRSGREMLRDADLAMYAAKDAGKGRFVFYESAMGERSRHRLEIRTALQDALEGGQLGLHYQPVYALDDGRLVGFEALLRWLHPTRGWIAPMEFIPAAEESNLIITIGRWVLDQAVRQLAAWQRMSAALDVPLSMAINLSPRQLLDPGLVGDVRRVLVDADVPPGSVCLEITEGAVVANSAAAAEVLAVLKSSGVQLAIDDYGSGNASINYLRQFDVDVLKIDRSLVSAMTDGSSTSAAIVRSIVELAGALGLSTVGEGIETPEQLEALRLAGCDVGQGYLLARPMDVEAATRVVQQASAALLGAGRAS